VTVALAVFAVVCLVVLLWAVDATLTEMMAEEPEHGAEVYPVIAMVAILLYTLTVQVSLS
jgi:hypothetical protein